jgi:hypothetical protein
MGNVSETPVANRARAGWCRHKVSSMSDSIKKSLTVGKHSYCPLVSLSQNSSLRWQDTIMSISVISTACTRLDMRDFIINSSKNASFCSQDVSTERRETGWNERNRSVGKSAVKWGEVKWNGAGGNWNGVKPNDRVMKCSWVKFKWEEVKCRQL